MEKMLNDYLGKIEKYLKPLAASERVDIVKEIKSEMLELQNDGVQTAQIIERLGDPKELAKAYLGETISKNDGFSWRKLNAVLVFCSLADIGGMIVLPFTSILGIVLMICGALCPVMGLAKLIAHLAGYELTQISVSVGSYTASAGVVLPVTVLMGVLLFGLGMLLWKLTMIIVRSISKTKKKWNNVA